MDLIHVVLGTAAATVGGLTYVLYFRSIAKGFTKPHAISWGVWAVLDCVAFVGQVTADAGPAAWLTGSTSALCAVTCLIGVAQRQVRIDRGDMLSLVGAAAAFVLMLASSNLLLAMIAAQVTTSIGYVPTARKVIRDPESEDLPTYMTATVKYVMQVGAISSYSALTLMQPVMSVIDSGCMAILIWRLQRAHQRDPLVSESTQNHPAPQLQEATSQ